MAMVCSTRSLTSNKRANAYIRAYAKRKEDAKEKELERQRKREARLLQAQNGNSLDFNLFQ